MKKAYDKWNRGLFGKAVVIMAGILISMAGTAMLISASFNLNKFYDVGAVYDIFSSQLQTPSEGIVYNYQKKNLQIQEEKANKTVSISPKQQGEWNYIYLNISQPENQTLDCRIIYKDPAGNIVAEKRQELVAGRNVIVSEGVSYSDIMLEFSKQAGKIFAIKKLQFREQEDVFSWKRAMLFFALLQISYYVIIWTGKWIWKKRGINCKISIYPFADKLQLLFVKTGNCLGNAAETWSEKVKRRGRTGVLMFLFFYMQIVAIKSSYISIKWFKYHMYVCVLAMILLCIFSWEKPLHKLNWNHRFVRIWFGFWILAAISEFIVPKRYAYQGILMIFVMGLFYFVWNNRLDREEILKNFRKALELWFWINVPLCHFFRPFAEPMRYTGMSQNANIWAMYMTFVLAAFLSEIESYFKETGRKKWIKCISSFIAVGIIWDFILKTGSSSGMVPMLLMVALWGIRLLKCIWKNQKKWQNAGYLLAGFVIVVSFVKVNDWGLHTIAYANDTAITFEEEEEILGYSDSFRLDFFSIKAQAEEKLEEKLEENRVFQKFVESASLEEFTSGRTLFWMGYIREMNLWGNEFAPMLWGSHRSAHNGIMAIMYRYGIFSVIPYMFLVLYYMKYSFEYKEKKLKSSGIEFFIKAISINVFILLMMENVEFPFYYFSWYALYLVMGFYFGNEPAEDIVPANSSLV